MSTTSNGSGSDLPEQAFRAFIRTYGLVRNQMEPYFARFGISGAQWGVLRALHRAENEGCERLRLTDLGRRLLVRPPSVTSLIDRLERLGLVARTVAEADQRAKLLTLTPIGRALVQRVLAVHPKQVRSIIGVLDQAEQRELQRLMERLGAHLEAMGTAGASGSRAPSEPTDPSESPESSEPAEPAAPAARASTKGSRHE